MPEFAHTETVHATPEAIFAILDDVPRTLGWLKRCTKIEKLSDGPLAVGTKLKYHYKEGSRTGVMDGQCTRHDAGRALTNSFTDKMMDVDVNFDVKPGSEPGTSSLTHRIDIRPKGFGKIFGPMIKKQLPGQTTGAMAELKWLGEGRR